MQIYSLGLILICIDRPDLKDFSDRFRGILVENWLYFTMVMEFVWDEMTLSITCWWVLVFLIYMYF